MGLLLCCLKVPGSDALFIRKTEKAVVKNLKDEIFKCAKMLGLKTGSDITWHEQRKTFTIYNGSTIELGSVWTSESYQKYIGLQYTWIWWEEAVQHTREDISVVNGSQRTDISGCVPKRIYSSNPGGVGHMSMYEDFVNPQTRKEGYRFVASTLFNALPTLVNDPGYLTRIVKGLPSYKVKQWVYGDWKAMAGQYFESVGEVLCEAGDPEGLLGRYANRLDSPGGIPYWARWYAGVDAGDNAPYAVLFASMWNDPKDNTDHIHFVREIYRRRVDLDDQAAMTLQLEKDLGKIYRINNDVIYYGDPAISTPRPSVTAETDRTVRQIWSLFGLHVIPSIRILRASGWQQMRLLMNKKMMTISPTGCPAFVKELQSAAYDKPESALSEDIDKRADDHALCGSSYLLRKVFRGGYNSEPLNPYSQWNRKSDDDEGAIGRN